MFRRTTALLATLALAVPTLTACTGAVAQMPQTGPAQSSPASALAPVLRQSAEEVARSAASLRQVDDLPMYEMTFHGGYDIEKPVSEALLAQKAGGWACSLYQRGAEFGRNFDWDPNPAILVRSDPPDGYASMALVDAFYVLGHNGPADLKDEDDRRRLGHAVLAPFDGMNEKGLAVGLAATPTAELPAPMPGRPALSSVRIIRMVLDRAATVEEALALFRAYNVDFDGGPQVHYLIADKSGASAVVEYADGKLNVIRDRILTNIAMTGTDQASRLRDTRYRTLAEGIDTKADGLDLLQRVAQGHTRWSVVYDLKAGTARLVTLKRWGTVRDLSLSSPG